MGGGFLAAGGHGGADSGLQQDPGAGPQVLAHTIENGGVAEGELERQDQVELTKPELIEALLSGQFKEIKWTATVALAILRTTTTT